MTELIPYFPSDLNTRHKRCEIALGERLPSFHSRSTTLFRISIKVRMYTNSGWFKSQRRTVYSHRRPVPEFAKVKIISILFVVFKTRSLLGRLWLGQVPTL